MYVNEFLEYLKRVENKNSVIHYNNTSFVISNIYTSTKFVVIALSYKVSIPIREIADKLISCNMGSYPIIVEGYFYDTYRNFTFDIKTVTMYPTSAIDYEDMYLISPHYI